MPSSSDRIQTVVPTIVLTLFLCFSFKADSLWTDEAFSAFMACHRTLSSLWHTLLLGDSSDLQMWLYYCYLHVWVTLFGDRELAFRAANIPFILIYSAVIVQVRHHLFRSNWVWLAALSPFIWAYAADARPYMALLALSTVFVACLVASFTDPRYAGSRALPWFGLLALLLGLNFSMLMVLLIPAGFSFLLTYRLATRSANPLALSGLQHWLRPALYLAPVFLAYFVFLVWTFGRGTNYDYAHPDLLSMGALLFRFMGLAGFAPNRHYDIPFRPYIPGMAVAAVGIILAAAITIAPAIRAGHARTRSLAVALLVGICEALTLSLVFKQQIEVRHIGCLFIWILFLFFSAWDFDPALHVRRFVPATVIIVASIWAISDFRLTVVSEYRREDFRSAVAEAVLLAQLPYSNVAVVADPAAAAYYGLAMTGPSPCFPLPGTCQAALSAVPWPRIHSAVQATFWSQNQIAEWLRHGDHPERKNQILLISRSRHPMYSKSPWWTELGKTKSYIALPFHGFFVYSSVNEKY